MKLLVETLGSGHPQLDITVPSVLIFRNAILGTFAVKLADQFTSTARDAMTRLPNYVGGAYIFLKTSCLDRINMLLESWKMAI